MANLQEHLVFREIKSSDEQCDVKLTAYDPKVSRHCSVHRPSLKELQAHSFTGYLQKVVLPAASIKYVEEFHETPDYLDPSTPAMQLREGLAKVVLPDGFQKEALVTDTTGRGPSWKEGTTLGDWEIEAPMQQHVHGISGIYHYTFTDCRDPLKMCQFREKADQFRKSQVGLPYERMLKQCKEEKDPLVAREKFHYHVERLFWKRVGPTMPAAWYGADQSGSLFRDDASGWSCAQLDSPLAVLSETAIPGVTTPYLYAGMWATVFCAHTEDVNLLSINYLHAGAPKFWYAVAEPDAPRFAALCQFHFSRAAADCPEFLRHKACMLSPAVLQKAGIRYQTCVQYPGEAVITMPASYHFGFNSGFNVAEATNFALMEWLPFGRRAKVCLCRPHSVRIRVDRLTSLLERYEEDQNGVSRDQRLSWKAWVRAKADELAKKKRQRDMETAKQQITTNVTTMKKKRKGKLSDQQKKKEFWVEITLPVRDSFSVATDGTIVKPTAKNTKKKKKKTRPGSNVVSETALVAAAEIWHLAKPIRKAKSLTVEVPVLCMMPGSSTLDTEMDEEEEEEQCFQGTVVEVDGGHVRVRLNGLPKSEDIWMLWSSAKLFLDGGRWQSGDNIPELHYWHEMDSKSRNKEAAGDEVVLSTNVEVGGLQPQPSLYPLLASSSIRNSSPGAQPKVTHVTTTQVSLCGACEEVQHNSLHVERPPDSVTSQPLQPPSEFKRRTVSLGSL